VGRLVILSGPTCWVRAALHGVEEVSPDVAGRLAKFVLYDSGRRARGGGWVDFHFRSRQFIESLRDQSHFRVFEVRSDLQAMDTRELELRCASDEARDVFFEGNPFIGSGLLDLAETLRVPVLSVFLSPLAAEEIVELKARTPSVCLPEFVTDVMRRKLLRRTARQKGILSQKDLENIEVRAASACWDMRQARLGSTTLFLPLRRRQRAWDAFYYPIGDARRALAALVRLLEGSGSAWAEKWSQELMA
jgi:guanylate kinase